MKFTAHEQRLIERLKKQERNWRYTRWILLFGGLLMAAMWAWILWKVYDATGEGTQERLLLTAFTYPKVLLGLTIAALFLAAALRDWSGSPTRRLLLRLVEGDADAAEPAEPTAPPNAGPATPLANSGGKEGPPSVS